jgi:hypothetical protein
MQECGAEDGTTAPLVEGARGGSTSVRRREGRWCCRAKGQTGRLCGGMGGGTWPHLSAHERWQTDGGELLTCFSNRREMQLNHKVGATKQNCY